MDIFCVYNAVDDLIQLALRFKQDFEPNKVRITTEAISKYRIANRWAGEKCESRHGKNDLKRELPKRLSF